MITKDHHVVILVTFIDWLFNKLHQERPECDRVLLICFEQAELIKHLKIFLEIFQPYFTQELFRDAQREAPEKVEQFIALFGCLFQECDGCLRTQLEWNSIVDEFA